MTCNSVTHSVSNDARNGIPSSVQTRPDQTRVTTGGSSRASVVKVPSIVKAVTRASMSASAGKLGLAAASMDGSLRSIGDL